MTKLRGGKCYTTVKRPYTRKSKYKGKSYVTGVPMPKIRMFDMGTMNGSYTHRVSLISTRPLQIRSEALEAARQVANKHLEKKLTLANYFFKILVHPHHILREHMLATGAGADRYTSGMAKSFGKPIGIAAQIRPGMELMYVNVAEAGLTAARESIKRAALKMPYHYQMKIERLNNV